MYLGTHSRVPAEAMDYLRRAARQDPAQTARVRMWMALVREFQPDPVAGEALYRSALEAATPISADAESILQLYARFLHKQGREEEAKQIEDRAKTVRQTLVSRAIAQKPAATAAFRAGGDVKAPTLLAKVEPEYSDDARQAKYQGTVVIYAVIGTDGLAHDMRVIKGLGLGLDDKAIEAIQRWHFRPGTRNGETVNVAATIEVNFRLL
jgi:TonB family protein